MRGAPLAGPSSTPQTVRPEPSVGCVACRHYVAQCDHQFILCNAQEAIPVIVLVMTNPTKPPPTVASSEIKSLAQFVFARGIITAPLEPHLDTTEVWRKVTAIAKEVQRNPITIPRSPHVGVVTSGTVAEFAALLTSGDAFTAPPGFMDTETPVEAFLDRTCLHAREKLTALFATEGGVPEPSQRLFEEAVACGVDVSVLIKWRGLRRAEDFEMFMRHPNAELGTPARCLSFIRACPHSAVMPEIVEYVLKKANLPLTTRLKEIRMTRVASLDAPPETVRGIMLVQ